MATRSMASNIAGVGGARTSLRRSTAGADRDPSPTVPVFGSMLALRRPWLASREATSPSVYFSAPEAATSRRALDPFCASATAGEPTPMSATARTRQPMRVLLTGYRDGSNWEPWIREAFTELGRSHDVTLMDPDRPLAEQVADPSIQVVVDSMFMGKPEVIAAAAGHVRLWQLGSVGYD